MTPEETPLHVGEPVDAAWGTLPDGTRTTRELTERGVDGGSEPSVVVVRLRGEAESNGRTEPIRSDGDERDSDRATAPVRVETIRGRYPDVRIIAYSVCDDPDAAIDASRLGIEYVSGRRLAADGETLADRIEAAGRSARSRGAGHDGGFLEPFVRIVSDGATDLEEKVDALLDLGRDHLGLSMGYSSRVDSDRLRVRQYRDDTGILDSLASAGLDGDGSVPLEMTYCRRTVRGNRKDGGDERGDSDVDNGTADAGGGDRGDDVFAFTDPEAAGLDGDPAYEQFGFGSYVGGRVVVNGELFGTLCFLDPDRRARPFDESEQTFVELLAAWLGRAIEREIAREEREAAVKRFEDTLERIDDAFFALDSDWRFTYVNEKAAALLGRDPDALLGETVWEEFPAALGQEYEESYRRAMETQESVSFEAHYEPLDLWTEVAAYPSPDGLSVFFADASERKRRERTLEHLLMIVERVQREGDAEGVTERLIEAAAEVLGHQISGVRLFDRDAGLLRLAGTSEGLGDRFAASRRPRPPGEGITGRVFEQGETRVYSDLAVGDELAPGDENREYHGMRSLVAVPLGTHGVFIVGSVEPNAFDESDVTVLELLATNAVATMDANERRRRLHTYEDALKNVDDMVCVLDDDGVVTYATTSFAAWFGAGGPAIDDRSGGLGDRSETSAEDGIAGRRLDALVSESDGKEIADAIASLSGAEVDSGRGDATRTVDLTVRGEGDTRARHGELRLLALSRHTDGVVASLSDVTDLHRTRTELSTERDRFQRLFDRIPDPVIDVVLSDDETVIDGLNPAFEERFGADATALRGQTIGALGIHEERLEADESRSDPGEDSLDTLVRERGFVTREVRRRTVDGPRDFLFRGFSYEAGGTRRAFGIYTDITERKRREQYVQIVNRILRHNLRNELNVVFGFAGEIAALTDEETVRDHARRIEATGKRLVDVAEGAATIRRVVEEGYVTEPAPIGVRAVVEEVVERHVARAPGAEIRTRVPDGVVVRGDDRLETALDHLVENAVDYGGDAPRVEVTADHDSDAGVVRVTVADDGPGIPVSVREVITGEREVTQLRHNTGVGLWIVAWVVAAYGGEIRFGPGLDGDGTAVTLALPSAE
ncbi:PAS domain-containing protein [Halorubrum kocurii]|uniref:histidine kinase n=1 Tax=Halorubrum kocurii JCM 14978 TaxID=1230456 RepID=M0NQH8_9EURY|nr:PAS domain-containing protein [Halorubrum kocurii]EMA59459.1 signal-transducing histidine kinase [Halorubrum kocurii JCM 14978]